MSSQSDNTPSQNLSSQPDMMPVPKGMLMIRENNISRPVTVQEYNAMNQSAVKHTGEISFEEKCQNAFIKEHGLEEILIDNYPVWPGITDENIRLTDTDGTYAVYHYDICDEKSAITTKHTRGIIKEVSGNVVCKTFNFTPEYIGKSDAIADAIYAQIGPLGLDDSQKVSIHVAEEGTLIRVWFHNNSWHISSHKKLNAKHSRWGSRESHYVLFIRALAWYIKHNTIDYEEPSSADPTDEEILQSYLKSLKTSRVYTYIVCPNDRNRVVCHVKDHPMIYFGGEFEKNVAYKYIIYHNSNIDDWTLCSENTSQIERPEKLSFASIGDMLSYVEMVNPYKAQGLMIYYGEDTVASGAIKLTSLAYQSLVDIRGNCPSIPFRYLQLRNDSIMVDKLIALYPSFVGTFQEYESILTTVGAEIYQGYITRFIHQSYVVLPQELWFIVKNLHDLYVIDRIKNKISRDLVTQHINSLSAVRLNFIIRRHKERKAENDDEQKDQ